MGTPRTDRYGIAFLAVLTLTMGCGISVAKNFYYCSPEQHEQSSTQKADQQPLLVDTLNTTGNGQY